MCIHNYYSLYLDGRVNVLLPLDSKYMLPAIKMKTIETTTYHISETIKIDYCTTTYVAQPTIPIRHMHIVLLNSPVIGMWSHFSFKVISRPLQWRGVQLINIINTYLLHLPTPLYSCVPQVRTASHQRIFNKFICLLQLQLLFGFNYSIPNNYLMEFLHSKSGLVRA